MGRDRTLFRQGGTCLLRDDRRVGQDDPYYPMHFTDILGEEAIRLVRASRRRRASRACPSEPAGSSTRTKPYEPAPEPHWSRTAAPGISDDQHRFRSMVARMDYQVGRILDTLDELGLARNTLVLFTSTDNGGAYEANIGDLKGGKTDLHEGGIRVPFLARWPARIRPGTESTELGHSTDLLPTCCSAAGVPLPAADRFDGRDLLAAADPDGSKAVPRGTLLANRPDAEDSQHRHEPKPKPYATEAACARTRWKLLAFWKASRWSCSMSRPIPANKRTGSARNPKSWNHYARSSPPGWPSPESSSARWID